MASSLESPTFRWKRDPWVTTPQPDNIDKSTAVDTLDERHQAVFQRAINNLLATELAEMTYAQLIDGPPLWEAALDQYRHTHTGEEPVFNHRELCPGVVDQKRAFLQSFDPLVMEIRSDALKRYQSAPVGSKASKIPLIELIAVAVHALAVLVFLEVNGGFHKHETWPSDDYYDENPIMRRKEPTPLILWLTFDTPEQYSDGVADIAAYWAEDRILGGVVLFGREKSGKEQNGVWFHSHHPRVTDHVYLLREDQIASLTHFLESDPDEASSFCPLPILGKQGKRASRSQAVNTKIYVI